MKYLLTCLAVCGLTSTAWGLQPPYPRASSAPTQNPAGGVPAGYPATGYPGSLPVPGAGYPTLAGQYPATGQVQAAWRGPVAAAAGNVANEISEIVAIVGDMPIVAGDLLPAIEQTLEEHKDKMPQDIYDQQKRLLMKQLLTQRIDVKMLYGEFLKTIPADKLEEALKDVHSQLDDRFYVAQLPKYMESAKVESPRELDLVFRKYGTSIAQRRQDFREQTLAQMMIHRTVQRREEISHGELLDYYHEHLDEYEFAARVRWEKLTALYARFDTKREAELHLVALGNEVLGGAPLHEVARRGSQGTHAAAGGFYDWTTQGALVSKVLDQAIFTYPPNELSPILADDQGFHIVRVIERTEAGRRSFLEVQDEMKEKIRDEAFKEDVAKFLEDVRRRTYVWTVFDEEEEPSDDE